MNRDDRLHAAVLGVGSALLFGLAAPVSKLLVLRAGPLILAGVLYLGAGGVFLLARRRRGEAPLERADIPVLLGAIIAGAVLGPPLLLWGLARVSGLTGSLLLNLEAPFTMLLAVFVFGEHLSRREAAGAALAVGGAALLGARGLGLGGSAAGAAAIALACLCWALDNNLTARLALKDPVQVLRYKTLGAGATNLLLGGLAGQRAIDARIAGAALLLGSVSYGASLLLYLRAQRILGAARQAALFAAAPFAGALLAIPLLGDRPGVFDLIAAALMATGVVLLLRARHAHLHRHDALEHEHLHVHDEHHQHVHDGPVSEPHSHRHRHEAIAHEHPHASDAHHRHRH
ncbi:MAG: DMT family transporter [Deltaproteobacteria bacterium]|nr:MAG: DMT family transporter [Deltaproteobacteria bacterium]